MTKKKSNFLAAVEGAASGLGGAGSRAAESPAPAGRGRAASGNRKDTRAHRVGRVNVTGYFDPAVKSSFRRIQMDHPELTVQELLEEALNDLFAKYRVPETARLHRGSQDEG